MPLSQLAKLQEFVTELRDPVTGCPWILVQTLQSLATLTIEESYELADSIEQGDMSQIRDELADVLLHVLLYAQLAQEKQAFTLDDIAQAALEKQLRRKPSFHANAAKTADEALKQWEENKAKEKAARCFTEESILDNIPKSLPNLQRALKIQQTVAKVGFDWADAKDILNKLTEEINEFTTEIAHQNHDKMTEELGDILFTVVNLARHYQIDPELALLKTNNKFKQRFGKLEQHFHTKKQALSDLDLAMMDKVWNEIKSNDK